MKLGEHEWFLTAIYSPCIVPTQSSKMKYRIYRSYIECLGLSLKEKPFQGELPSAFWTALFEPCPTRVRLQSRDGSKQSFLRCTWKLKCWFFKTWRFLFLCPLLGVKLGDSGFWKDILFTFHLFRIPKCVPLWGCRSRSSWVIQVPGLRLSNRGLFCRPVSMRAPNALRHPKVAVNVWRVDEIKVYGHVWPC